MHRPERYGAAAHGWEAFAGPLSQQGVPGLLRRCGQLVFFLAAGAVTRLLAPCLVSKESDPGVLAVDEAGQFVISLLSGHKGGANAFARTVAGCLGATPVVTTASDVMGGLSLDLLEDAFGWTVEPRERLTQAARSLVDGEPVVVIQEIGAPGCWMSEVDLPANVTVARDAGVLEGRRVEYVLWITDRRGGRPWRKLGEERILWYSDRRASGCWASAGELRHPSSRRRWRTGWNASSPSIASPGAASRRWRAWRSNRTRRAFSNWLAAAAGQRSFTLPRNWRL